MRLLEQLRLLTAITLLLVGLPFAFGQNKIEQSRRICYGDYAFLLGCHLHAYQRSDSGQH